MDGGRWERTRELNLCRRKQQIRLRPPVLSGSRRTVREDKGATVCNSNVPPVSDECNRTRHRFLRVSTRTASTGTHVTCTRLTHIYQSGVFGACGCACGRAQHCCIHSVLVGAANCMALVEMHVILAWVLRRFKLSKAPKFALENWGGSVVPSFLPS